MNVGTMNEKSQCDDRNPSQHLINIFVFRAQFNLLQTLGTIEFVYIIFLIVPE